MEMRLTVIGSSPAHPNPGSAHSGYLVEDDGCGRLLLDCGPGVLSRLRAADLLPVSAIAVTHLHLDHWGDLVPWVWLSHTGGGISHRPQLWLPPEAGPRLDAFAAQFGTAGMFQSTFDVSEYEPGAPFRAAGFELVAHAVEHYGVPAFGLRVSSPTGRVLGYSGDSGPCAALHTIADGADLFLCEATLESGDADAHPRGHLSADEALEIASGPLVVTHRPFELDTPSGTARAADGLILAV
jgi:ribonuclease BN (tRNA processing enzyme)